MYKLVALDIDGTILNGQHQITERMQSAIRLAHEQGCLVVFCSARPLNAIKQLLAEYELSNCASYIVAGNGSWLYDVKSGRDLHFQALSQAELVDLNDVIQRFGFDHHYFSRDVILSTQQPVSEYTRFESSLFGLPLIYQPFGQVFQQTILKISLVGDKATLDKKLSLLPANVYNNFQAVRTADNYFEIMKKGSSKGGGLQFIAEKEGILPAEVIAVGDHENDISMIHYAGLGVAMGNASERLKECADSVTSSNNEDGAAEVIEHHILNGR